MSELKFSLKTILIRGEGCREEFEGGVVVEERGLGFEN